MEPINITTRIQGVKGTQDRDPYFHIEAICTKLVNRQTKQIDIGDGHCLILVYCLSVITSSAVVERCTNRCDMDKLYYLISLSGLPYIPCKNPV